MNACRDWLIVGLPAKGTYCILYIYFIIFRFRLFDLNICNFFRQPLVKVAVLRLQRQARQIRFLFFIVIVYIFIDLVIHFSFC